MLSVTGIPAGRWHRLLPWLLLGGLIALRIYSSVSQCPSGKVDPDVGFWSRGAKHWAFYGTWGHDDISTEFVAPAHAWALSGVFRLFGPSYSSAVGWAQAAVALAMILAVWGLRRESPAALALTLLFFWADSAVSWCAYSGGVEPTQLIGVSASMVLAIAGQGKIPRWAASGFFYAWAVAAKPTALVLAPAYGLLALRGEERMEWPGAFRRLAAFAAGTLLPLLAAALFLTDHLPEARRAWDQMRFQAGDHERSLLDAAGITLFHWGNFGWRHTLVPLFLFSLPACAPAFFSRDRADPWKKQQLGWALFFLVGLAGLTLFPPGARRYVLVALPLSALAAQVLARPDSWEATCQQMTSRGRRLFLLGWAVLALFPLLSYVKEPLASWLLGRTGSETAWCQSRAGFLLLAAAVPALFMASRAARFLGGARQAPHRWLLVGGSALLANFLLVRTHGILGKFFGGLEHMDPAWRTAPREAVERAALAAGISWLLSFLFLCGAWRLWVADRAGAARPREVRLFFTGLAGVLAAAGILWPILRLARTEQTPSALLQTTRELAALIPLDSTVYGGRYVDVSLLPVRCRVITPWAWHGRDVESFLASTERYRWNLPIERFQPEFLLLEDEAEDSDVGRVWGRWLSGIERKLIGEFPLDRHVLRLYALK